MQGPLKGSFHRSKRGRDEGSKGEDLQLKLHACLLMGMAFIFPFFQDGLSLAGILLGVNGIVFAIRAPSSCKAAFRSKRGHGLPLLIAAFFLCYVLGTTYTDHPSIAAFELQKRVAFLFFPLLYAFMPSLEQRAYERVLMAFVGGSVLACGLGFYNAFSNYLTVGDPSPYLLYGNYFAYGIHRGYLAIYLLFAFFLLFDHLLKGFIERRRCKNILGSLLLFFLLSGIYMTTSRTALLILPLLVLVLVFRNTQVNMGRRILLSVGILILLAGSVTLFSKNIRRFHELTGMSEESFEPLGPGEEGNSVRNRLMIWSVAWDLYKGNWIAGLGTGDDDKALERAYRENGYESLSKKRSDAHCQFLQTGIAVGSAGILLLLAIFTKAMIGGMKRNGALLAACIILLGSALFESVLERQAGILFMAFFLPLLHYGQREGQAP